MNISFKKEVVNSNSKVVMVVEVGVYSSIHVVVVFVAVVAASAALLLL